MSSRLQILAIADDATGALEVGGQLAMGGIRSRVTTAGGLNLEAEALVADLETRHLAAAEAGRRVRALALEARQVRIPHIYKKTDSTLRGNIPSEFQALIETFPDRLLVYVPAYPKMGRTVKDGQLYVHGKPLAETATAADPLSPSGEGNIPALLASGCGAPVAMAEAAARLKELLRDSACGSIVVCDGASDEDLRRTAEAIAGSGRECMAAGTGGFVAMWASHLPLRRGYGAMLPEARRCLVVSGSLHPASRAQVRRAESSGIPTLYLGRQPDQETARFLARHNWAALATAADCDHGVARRMGAVVRSALSERPADCLVIFGGDTVLAVLEALGATTVDSAGELMPGVPVSVTSCDGRPLVLVTKAGGFGQEDALLLIKRRLEKGR